MWDDLFSVMLLGDITVVNHKTINCCYSGFFLINTSILKSNSMKIADGTMPVLTKTSNKAYTGKASQVPDEICDP